MKSSTNSKYRLLLNKKRAALKIALHSLGLFVFGFLVLTACSAPLVEPSEQQAPIASNTPAPTPQDTEPSPGEPEDTGDPQPETAAIQLSELDPCKYVNQKQVEQFLSVTVTEIIPADSDTLRSCTYIIVPGEKFLTISVYPGEAARLYFLDEIAQLQEGCSVSYSYSTNADAPTPLPPEVQALMENSVLDLFVMDLELQAGCGGSYQALPDLGSNVFTYQTWLQGAVVGIAADDLYMSLLYADIGVDTEELLEVVKQLIRSALLNE